MVSAASPAPRRRWHRQFLALLPQIVTRAELPSVTSSPKPGPKPFKRSSATPYRDSFASSNSRRPVSPMPRRWPPSESSKPVTADVSAGTSIASTSLQSTVSG